jgi:hypothetical protein
MGPPRFRLWMLMVLVATVAVAMGLQRRRADFLDRAGQHRRMEQSFHEEFRGASAALEVQPQSGIWDVSEDLTSGCGWARYKGVLFQGKERVSTLIAALDQMEAHHAMLRKKYEQAARYPWLPVPPDPPPPG